MRFREDIWVGDGSLAESYPSLYCISHFHDKPIASFALFNPDRSSQSSISCLSLFCNLREFETSEM